MKSANEYTKAEFLEEVELFLHVTGMAPSTFGALAKNERNFVETLQDGRECKEKVKQTVLDFMLRWKEQRISEKEEK